MRVKKIVSQEIPQSKFIVITGGVCSSIGKGVLVSSLGVLLKTAGYSVSVVKMDPYLNVDPGTMSPLEHGEVFVTSDGAETDLDLGHYERLLSVSLTRDSSVSAGQIFKEIIEGEREGRYLGRCIQLVPHVVMTIKNKLLSVAQRHNVDFVLLEIGGTVGDMEGQVFLEAIRQLRMEIGTQLFHGHLSYVPFLEWTGEIKTKPTQHSVQALKEAGLAPDALFLRASQEVSPRALKKLAIMCGVPQDFIFQVPTCNPIYQIFPKLKRQGLSQKVQEYFGFQEVKNSNLKPWEDLLLRIGKCKKQVSIGLVAKYVDTNDPYISVIEALKSAGYANDLLVKVELIDAEKLETQDERTWGLLKKMDGIVGPGGFDSRGVEGKIAAVEWARQHKVPYLGLCLGMQVMLIEIGRSLVGLKNANSTEFDKEAQHPVISLQNEQEHIQHKGASMRLGTYPCSLEKGSKAYDIYQADVVHERHRHRYEFNNVYKDRYIAKNVIFSGVYKENNLVEIAEYNDHPFMVGVQFHPEFLSSPLLPHPLFKSFIEAAVKNGSATK